MALSVVANTSIIHPGAILDTSTGEDIGSGEGVRFSLVCSHAGLPGSLMQIVMNMLLQGSPLQCPHCPPGHGQLTSR